MDTFVKAGDRVRVYGKPYSNQEIEGTGKVVLVSRMSDMESAYVGVLFDDDPEGYGVLRRWVLPSHVEGRK